MKQPERRSRDACPVRALRSFADGLSYCRLIGGHRPMTWEKLDLILKMLGYPSL
ncbi:TPA_asm: hypothetical protein GNC57_004605 [Salmonella enterica subsp. salamae serovar 48:d:z6]|uniref:Uncharacterized protein n=1 Tax=Salmonella enterica subsp. salamae serovar 48:d:z6 TaxID=1151170 RepID=A0A729Q1L1_SALER|nr:hypothetical protein [Salmonella enterica subsp. enterica]HAE3252658.1 hypothetical protein [Salmonella enterica subsp. salamae serovar 48:d:z6]HAE7840619.1 hypothetical protein [Salmonella enterica subsp. salamae serovar 48:d:z6]HBM0098122.1 hypothetical protein [Salmonella enterica subsp. enterica serovar Blitta]